MSEEMKWGLLVGAGIVVAIEMLTRGRDDRLRRERGFLGGGCGAATLAPLLVVGLIVILLWAALGGGR